MKALIIILTALAFISCGGKKDKTKKDDKTSTDKTSTDKTQQDIESKNNTQKVNNENSALNNYDIENISPKILEIDKELMEISGITFTKDDRLFAHGDEEADVYELDPSTGKIIKTFKLGAVIAIKGDFEDIAAVNDKFYMTEANGKLYEFSEGGKGQSVEFKTYKTPLSAKNDVEGLCFDSETMSLLLACKELGGADLGKDKAIYSFSLVDKTMNEKPRFVISQKEIKNNTEEGKFNPSGISRNPITGTFFVIAARGNTILELSKTGELLGQKNLPDNIHVQAEGIAFKTDGTLYISNEGRGKIPTIVVYEMKK